MMLIKKTRLSKYTLRKPSPRVTPSNSLSSAYWDNETSYNRKNVTRRSARKIKYTLAVITCSLTIAILIAIAILVPLITKLNSITTKSTLLTSSITATTNVASIPTISVLTILSTTKTTTKSTTSLTTTITVRTSTSTTTTTTSQTATSAVSPSTTTTLKMTTTTESSSTSTTSESTIAITISETTTVTVSTGITTTSETTTITETTSISTTSGTTTSTIITYTTSINTFLLRWNSTGTTFAGELNATNATSNYLNNPVGIVLDSSDVLYVADSLNSRIQQFLLSNTTGMTVAGQSNGLSGSTANRLNSPNDVAVDSNGNLYVVDTNNHRIQLWRVNVTSGITIAGNGTPGDSNTQLDSPRGIALDSNTNTFYVSDGNNDRVMSYTLNSTMGTLVAGGNGSGKNNTQLNSPRGLHFDATTNSLIIANYAAHNIVRWVIGASSWTIVVGRINGTFGSGSTTLWYPWDVTLDPMGNVYVADRANHRIQFFRAGEMNGTTIAGETGQSGDNSTRLNRPLSIALDSQLNLYVSDTFNNRIQKFSRY